MNAKQLKDIPVGDLVQKLGGKFIKSVDNNRDLYTSPFREETKGSLYVYKNNNKWNDFGHVGRKSGDGLDLVCEYLSNKGQSSAISDGIEYAAQLLGQGYTIKAQQHQPTTKAVSTNRVVVDSIRNELSPSTLNYVQQTRQITDREIIRNNLKQVHFHFEKTPERKLYAAAFGNDKGGFELRASTPTKELKYVAGEKALSKTIGADRSRLSVFEGFFDYLTYLQRNRLKTPDTDIVVLNTNALVTELLPVIEEKGYKGIDVYKQKDAAGQKVYDEIAEKFPTIPLHDKSNLYKDFNDYNEMHVKTAPSINNKLSKPA